MKRAYTILIDEREKHPLSFPDHLVVWDSSSPALAPRPTTIRLTTRTTRLPTGDYLLEGFERAAIAERKGSLQELHANLCTPQGRRKFTAELVRLRNECEKPLVLLEGDPLSLSTARLPPIAPPLVRDILLHTLDEYNVPLMLLPTSSVSARRVAAEWLAALLIRGSCTCPSPQPPPPPSLPSATRPA